MSKTIIDKKSPSNKNALLEKLDKLKERLDSSRYYLELDVKLNNKDTYSDNLEGLVSSLYEDLTNIINSVEKVSKINKNTKIKDSVEEVKNLVDNVTNFKNYKKYVDNSNPKDLFNSCLNLLKDKIIFILIATGITLLRI